MTYFHIQVRTAVVSVLNEIPVNDFEAVSSTITILNQATEVKEEISEEAQVNFLTHFTRKYNKS